MERLLEQLTATGVVDPDQAVWARQHRRAHQGSLDEVLLELDMIDEESLLKGLAARHRSRVATRALLDRVDPSCAQRLPEKFSNSFRMCPLRFEDGKLIALVEAPLPPEWTRELVELLGVEVDDFVAPQHFLAVARARVYGATLSERTLELETRLARHRAAKDPASVAAEMAQKETLSAAMDELLSFCACLLDFSCFLSARDDKLHVIGGHAGSSALPLPEPGCTLGPAIIHGGYFLGSPTESDADRRYYRELGRALPRRAFVAPVPSAPAGRVVLYADNGSRGIANRWVAELTVLVGRLARRSADREHVSSGDAAQARHRSGGRVATPDPSSIERAALERLRRRASEVGVSVNELVDRLLDAQPPAAPADNATVQLMGEMKSLFERLATDIPAHLARGMEHAFRDLAPRMGTGDAATALAARPPAAVGPELVQRPAAAREPASYASFRKKTPRRQL